MPAQWLCAIFDSSAKAAVPGKAAMKLSLTRLGVAAILLAALLNADAAQAQAPVEILKTCKIEVGARYPNIPMAYITVDRGSKTANNNYLVNWTAKPPGGQTSVGLCVVDASFNVLRFDTTAGPKTGSASPNISTEQATRVCKNEAASHLRTVPMAYISADPAGNAADGSYIINWRSQPPRGVSQSGFCNVTLDGKVREFKYDASAAKPPG